MAKIKGNRSERKKWNKILGFPSTGDLVRLNSSAQRRLPIIYVWYSHHLIGSHIKIPSKKFIARIVRSSPISTFKYEVQWIADRRKPTNAHIYTWSKDEMELI